MALVLGDDFAALGDALDRYDGDTGPSDRERFGREEAERFLALLAAAGAAGARAARSRTCTWSRR